MSDNLRSSDNTLWAKFCDNIHPLCAVCPDFHCLVGQYCHLVERPGLDKGDPKLSLDIGGETATIRERRPKALNHIDLGRSGAENPENNNAKNGETKGPQFESGLLF